MVKCQVLLYAERLHQLLRNGVSHELAFTLGFFIGTLSVPSRTVYERHGRGASVFGYDTSTTLNDIFLDVPR